MTVSPSLSRRAFLQATGSCAAHLALMASPFPLAARTLWSGKAGGEIVAEEPFGRLERVGDGLYALISTPLTGDYTTVSNGGIIAGQKAVLVVEALQTVDGASWLAAQARHLTGRWPTHLAVTHYHGDHTRGIEGYSAEGSGADTSPAVLGTAVTRDMTLDSLGEDASEAVRGLWRDMELLDPRQSGGLDLGSRSVQFAALDGHTPSDLAVELPEDGLIWCGDLVWNGMFPNYMDAIPTKLSKAVRIIAAGGWSSWVPGHGPLADAADMDRYISVIDGIEETARQALREGWTAEEAGKRHTIPSSLGEWTLFNPLYFQRAIEAWMDELG